MRESDKVYATTIFKDRFVDVSTADPRRMRILREEDAEHTGRHDDPCGRRVVETPDVLLFALIAHWLTTIHPRLPSHLIRAFHTNWISMYLRRHSSFAPSRVRPAIFSTMG